VRSSIGAKAPSRDDTAFWLLEADATAVLLVANIVRMALRAQQALL
jgi:hypothetical protein